MVLNNRSVATGMIRKGVINIVRTMPRPKNFRFTRRASALPRSIARITAEAVISTVRTAACRNAGSAKAARYSANPAKLLEPGTKRFQRRKLYQRVTRKGTWVTMIDVDERGHERQPPLPRLRTSRWH